jgi:hypothetical protein
LLAGILLGPYVLNLIRTEIIAVSSDLSEIAMIVILVRVGKMVPNRPGRWNFSKIPLRANPTRIINARLNSINASPPGSGNKKADTPVEKI